MGGTIAKAVADGHRVVLVFATRGERGEVQEGFLQPGEALGLRRVAEAIASGEVLGVDRVEFLGYVDSGMMGEPTNDGPYTFWKADPEFAAGRLAAILREESADILTTYDEIGGYGHPDHLQVHAVGHRAAELAGTPHVYESTINRDHIVRAIAAAAESLTAEQLAEMPDLDNEPDFGMPEHRITHAVDVSDFVEAKRNSMRCHASQISDEAFFLAMPEDQFQHSFGTEWFIDPRMPRSVDAPFRTSLFEAIGDE
jgi:LmbE family N-acetylglucosaminyl deacetylase